MAHLELMTWNASDKRWHKGYRGRRYAVSPRQLKTAPNKEASRQAANQWWEQKQKEIDEQLGKAKEHPPALVRCYDLAIRNHRVFAWWQRREGNLELAAKSDQAVEFLQESLLSDNLPVVDGWAYSPWGEPTEIVEGGIPIDRWESILQWRERINEWERQQQAETAAPRENTIRAHIDQYLETLKVRAKATGKLGTYETTRYRLEVFRKWCDPRAEIEAINEALWERFCLYLFKQVGEGEMAAASMAGIQGAARSFIRDRHNRRTLDLPRNLNARNLAASVPLKEPQTMTTDEVRELLAAASDRRKLYLLLMLNTGMYPSDIAKLEKTEVDWEAGRIRRKRTKTRDRSANVPKVDYLLWRETFSLLKKFRADHPTLALVNEDGQPLWKEVERDGRIDRDNNIRTAYFQLLQTKPLKDKRFKSLKALRKTPATMLQQSAYGRFSEHFLGEAPHSITAKHYAHENGTEFDKAVKWLGRQFGIK